jgi:geranylgeranyl reductase
MVANADYDPDRCDVIYDGRISPDFYGWVFPHGDQGQRRHGHRKEGVDLKQATAELRRMSGLAQCETIRKEGAPIPLKPWTAGTTVATWCWRAMRRGWLPPVSGEGIYYAMAGGRAAATAAQACLRTGRAKDLRVARKLFMREHGTVFRVLRSDAGRLLQVRRPPRALRQPVPRHRRAAPDLRGLHEQKLVAPRPLAHLKIGVKNLAHLLGLVSPKWS